MSDEAFLSRWSRRKRAQAAGLAPDEPTAVAEAAPALPVSVKPASMADKVPVGSQENDALSDALSTTGQLPDIESLTPASDFSPFMRAGVAAEQRNAALRRLFTDPHFNVMDGLDIYIDDYSRPDPIAPAMLAAMEQLKSMARVQAALDSRVTSAPPTATDRFDTQPAGDQPTLATSLTPQSQALAAGHATGELEARPAAGSASPALAPAGAGPEPRAGTETPASGSAT
jgi:hypothetical protein